MRSLVLAVGSLVLGAFMAPLQAQHAPLTRPLRVPADSAVAPAGSDCPMPVAMPRDGVDSMPTVSLDTAARMPTARPTCTNSRAPVDLTRLRPRPVEPKR